MENMAALFLEGIHAHVIIHMKKIKKKKNRNCES
jgi:hypothetical protein